MALGGGTFTTQKKTLPGAYINFISLATTAQMGVRGVAALPLALDWGPAGEVIRVEASEFNKTALRVFAAEATDDSLLLVREALKRARTLLIYRVNGNGTAATVTVGGLKATAKHPGTRGNALRVAVQTNVDNEAQFDVITYLDTGAVDTQTVTAAAELVANDYVSFAAAGDELTPAVAAQLAGGTNSTPAGSDYQAALDAFEVETFNTIGYPGTDETTKRLFAAFVKRLRYETGVKITGVLHGYTGDDIGLINVKNGVVLADTTVIPGDKAVAWVTGATAGAAVNESLTNTAYDDAVDVDEKYTPTQHEAAIKAGEFAFYADNGKARVLTDINSLTSIDVGMSQDWTSNRVVRVMDGFANDTARIFGESYLGKVTNSATGRTLLKADLVSLGKQYEELDALSDFASEDIVIAQGDLKRNVMADCKLRINDSMEFLYMQVVVA